MGWEKLSSLLNKLDGVMDHVVEMKHEAGEKFGEYRVYPNSINIFENSWMFIARGDAEKSLIIYGENSYYNDFEGYEIEIEGKKVKICDLSNKNCFIIMRMFPFTKPVNHRGKKVTLGLGDRLGIASAGHIRLLRNKPVFPILAQQSIRELNLTGRTYEDVLCAAAWAVFQEGYKAGYGADGDHLKTFEEVEMALRNGFTMITLDCSEHINYKVSEYDAEEIEKKYIEIDENERAYFESKYVGKPIRLKDDTIIVSEIGIDEFKKIALTYIDAMKYTIYIYNNLIKSCGRKIDFEMSIDETLTSTTPAAHYFVASELIDAGVDIASLAPRFCGEFQKGIDYIGDIEQFEKEFAAHVKIAKNFGYKISIHSGSDKFAVFPIIGRITGSEYHLKTAGTNWLEAVRVIAAKNPSLYRKIHKFALENLNEAKKYYAISANPANIPDIDNLKDEDLPILMDKNDSRQILHITYGLILTALNPNGTYKFKDDILKTLYVYEDEYYLNLRRHIGRHLEKLGI